MTPKSKRADVRLTEYEWNKLKTLARIYAGGNLSLWLRYAGLNAPRKKVNPNDLKL